MKKDYWLGVQDDIFRKKFLFWIYVVLWFFFHTIVILPGLPLFPWPFRILIDLVGVVILGIVWFVCKEERTAEQDKRLKEYLIVMLIVLVWTVARMYF